ncbi:MAG: response regulator [Polyangiaceae bacterium]|jgi:two-component system chemotaxis response regulator CheY
MGRKIIVVDDSSVIRSQVANVLAGAGYRIVEAANGNEGLKRIEEHADAAMVLSDINMPQMSGIEMLVQMKAGGKNAALPVIMLTTEGNVELMTQAKRAGAKAWIVKPFRDELLVETVRKIAGPA